MAYAKLNSSEYFLRMKTYMGNSFPCLQLTCKAYCDYSRQEEPTAEKESGADLVRHDSSKELADGIGHVEAAGNKS